MIKSLNPIVGFTLLMQHNNMDREYTYKQVKLTLHDKIRIEIQHRSTASYGTFLRFGQINYKIREDVRNEKRKT